MTNDQENVNTSTVTQLRGAASTHDGEHAGTVVVHEQGGDAVDDGQRMERD